MNLAILCAALIQTAACVLCMVLGEAGEIATTTAIIIPK